MKEKFKDVVSERSKEIIGLSVLLVTVGAAYRLGYKKSEIMYCSYMKGYEGGFNDAIKLASKK